MEEMGLRDVYLVKVFKFMTDFSVANFNKIFTTIFTFVTKKSVEKLKNSLTQGLKICDQIFSRKKMNFVIDFSIANFKFNSFAFATDFSVAKFKNQLT